MTRFAAFAVALALMASPVVFSANAVAAPGGFKNCTELNKAYPNGVAKSAAWAAKAVQENFYRPRVNKKVWDDYWFYTSFTTKTFSSSWNVLCGKKKPPAVPSSVEYLQATASASYRGQPPTLLASWGKPQIGGAVVYDVYLNGQLWKEGLTDGLLSITPLAAETTYTVGVRARNSSGTGPLLEVQGTTLPQSRYQHYGEVLVRYEMTGSSGSYSLTMASSNGGTVQRDSGNGVVYEAWFTDNDFVYLAAQNNNESGSVTCMIYRDGLLTTTNTSDGAYVIASCSGRA